MCNVATGQAKSVSTNNNAWQAHGQHCVRIRFGMELVRWMRYRAMRLTQPTNQDLWLSATNISYVFYATCLWFCCVLSSTLQTLRPMPSVIEWQCFDLWDQNFTANPIRKCMFVFFAVSTSQCFPRINMRQRLVVIMCNQGAGKLTGEAKSASSVQFCAKKSKPDLHVLFSDSA